MVVTGRTAALYMENGLELHRHLLEGTEDLDRLRGGQRIDAEVRIAAFMGNLEFGEFCPEGEARPISSRVDCLRSIVSTRPGALRLQFGNRRRTISIQPPGGAKIAPIEMGYVNGYTLLFPVSREIPREYCDQMYGYINYVNDGNDPSLYLAASYDEAQHISIDEVACIPFPVGKGDVISRNDVAADQVLQQAYLHLSDFLPAFSVDDSKQRLTAYPRELPAIKCWARKNSVGSRLAMASGFERVTRFERRGLGRGSFARFALDLKEVDLGRAAGDPSGRRAINKILRYQKLINLKEYKKFKLIMDGIYRNESSGAAHPDHAERAAAGLAGLVELNEDITLALASFTPRLRAILEDMPVGSLGDREANDALVDELARVLRRLELGVECPKDAAPSILRNYPGKGQSHGNMRFLHSERDEEGRTRQAQHGGFETFDALKVVPRPYSWGS